MTKTRTDDMPPLFLGIEAGGTRTVAILANGAGQLLKRVEAGPANLRLLSDAQLSGHFRSLAKEFPRPDSIGVGMAGLRNAEDANRITQAAAKVWPNAPCAAANDLETALSAAEAFSNGERAVRVVVLSGTGSCCSGRTPNGQTAKVGGWGHLLGDKGSGYEIGLRALKAVVYYFDRDGVWPALGQRILRAAQLNDPEALIGWAQNADKAAIAALAIEVFAGWTENDSIARDILEGAASSLAKDAVTCAKRLVRPGTTVHFILTGSVLLKQPRFAGFVRRKIVQAWPKAKVAPLKTESVWGAIHLASQQLDVSGTRVTSEEGRGFRHPKPTVPGQSATPSPGLPAAFIPDFSRSGLLPPTEQRNPRSMKLSELPLSAAIALMLREEGRVPAAVLVERRKIERAIRWIVRAFKNGGRLFYAGAGTSGRLGVLDASECPPTFRAAPDQVQGIIAGGPSALWTSIEGAEDDAAAGARAISSRGVKSADIVVGIAASGRTPFVWGALNEASRRGATTILVCFNPSLKIPRAHRPDLIIAPSIGPEVLTGSTRLKAGTATKLILNLFTTLSMVRLGKVISNLMVDLNPANAKLRDRAVRIVQELTGAESAEALAALEKSSWIVKSACARLGRIRIGSSRKEGPRRRNGKAGWIRPQ